MLGYGSDWAVWRTSRETALKILEKAESLRRELERYRRLQARGVRELAGFAIPFLEGSDERWLAIEMTIVEPPYLLDFGKVHLDAAPPYWNDRQIMAEAHAQWKERFGGDWPEVTRALNLLRSWFGIYYVDPRPANICLRHESAAEDAPAWQSPEDVEPPTEDSDAAAGHDG